MSELLLIYALMYRLPAHTFCFAFLQVLDELHHYSETWVGMELTPVIAYGFRLYRDGSTLDMHIDKAQSHVISFILHIDSSEDSDPWPILIEDFEGSKYE